MIDSNLQNAPQQTYSEWVYQNTAYYRQVTNEYATYYSDAAKANVAYYAHITAQNITYYANYSKEALAHYSQAAIDNTAYYAHAIKTNVQYTVHYAKESAVSLVRRMSHFIAHLRENTAWAIQKSIEYSQYFAARAIHHIKAGFNQAQDSLGRGLVWSWKMLVAGYHWGYALSSNLIQNFGYFIKGTWRAIYSIGQTLGTLLKDSLSFLFRLPHKIIVALKTSLNFLISTMKFILTLAKRVIASIPNLALRLIKNAWSFVSRHIIGIGKLIRSIFKSVYLIATKFIRHSWAFFKAIPNHLFQLIKAIQTSFYTFIHFLKRIGHGVNETLRYIGNQLLSIPDHLGAIIKTIGTGLVNIAKHVYQNFGNILHEVWEGICSLGDNFKMALAAFRESFQFCAGKLLNAIGGITGVGKFMLDKMAIGVCIVYAMSDLLVGWVGSLMASLIPQSAVNIIMAALPFGGLLATSVGLLSTGLTLGLTAGTIFFAGYGLYKGVMWATSNAQAHADEPVAGQAVDADPLPQDFDMRRVAPAVLNQFRAVTQPSVPSQEAILDVQHDVQQRRFINHG